MTKKGKAKPSECKFQPIPDLHHPMTADFRKQLVERLKQDDWSINRTIELLMEKRLETRGRIVRIERELKEEADRDG